MAAAPELKNVTLPVVSPGGPSLAYHVAWLAGGSLYVHGGIDKVGSKTPLGHLHRFDFESNIWSVVRSPGSPARSHHSCVVVDGRYAVIIGGWNGKERTSSVHIYDTEASRWCSPNTTGFPTGAGLSSHSSVLLADKSILVVGREGSLRLQRRFGSAFMLHGNPAVGASGEFHYVEHTVYVTSRSGHTMHIVNQSVIIVGGRDDKVIEEHPYRNSLPNSEQCHAVSALSKQTASATAVSKDMTGRKHHVSASSSGAIFVHGGWTFDGKSREPVGQMYILITKPTTRWVYLGDSRVCRAGHVCCCDDKTVYIHGGEGPRQTIHSTLYQLKVDDALT